MTDDEKELMSALASGAAEGLSKKVPPIYDDLLKPSTQLLGKGLAGLIKVALTPISATVWGYDKIAEWLVPELESRLVEVLPENIAQPSLNLIGPAIESLKFLSDEQELKEMFANLIASSLNSEVRKLVHPGFVETLKNLSGHDARLLKYIYTSQALIWMEIIYSDDNEDTQFKCLTSVDPDNNSSDLMLLSINNFNRLGICIPYEKPLPEEIAILKRVPFIDAIFSRNGKIEFKANRCELTPYGRQFCEICI